MADNANMIVGETPLEASMREVSPKEREAAQTRREELEADRLVGDIDTYVAETDPASLPAAEKALNDWDIPTDPLEGVPDTFAVAPGVEGRPLVSVFAARNEAEANIVRGVLEASGIPVVFDGLPSPIMGSVFQAGETRWGDLLVPAGQVDEALAAISDAVSSTTAV
jgi:hypothetical protein